MKFIILYFLAFLFVFDLSAQDSKTYPLYVDNQGVLRRTSNNIEVAYCGVNYTLPFAHSFRAAEHFGVDRYKQIDNDVYHFARLGFNAFRLHIWDVEISDSIGNVIDNEHLKVLDYLIMRLEERGIDVVLTAQTDFGNGYPERSIMTGGFSYLYKHDIIHSDPQAVKAQQNYIKQLVQHVNHFTGKSYLSDTCIVAFEINNEPTHSVSIEDTKNYINSMVSALKSVGYNKTIFYNVSHNHDFVSAYFDSDINVGTYQWYPTGLVSGKEKTLNFLPYVDEYNIDFQDVPGFSKCAKAIYEFDPADILDTYLYPATIRSFRSAGFQWATQFAYDASFLASYNTDYQTHYLNLLYTPGKAVGMKIACELFKKIPLNAKFEKYPNDTLFYGCTVSYNRNLAVYNASNKFFYTNNCDVLPANDKNLTEICGVGSSKIVKYSGTGAYFLDKLAKGVWRLEVLPDQLIVADPFAKPSYERKVGVLQSNYRSMIIHLPDLGSNFQFKTISGDLLKLGDDSISVTPGVYLLTSLKSYNNATKFLNYEYNNIKVSEFYSPENNVDKIYLVHQPKKIHELGQNLVLTAKVAAPKTIDSVVVYPSNISFWNHNNKSIRMLATDNPFEYQVEIPSDWYFVGDFGYYILVYSDGKCTTYPSGNQKNPLDWDADEQEFYTLKVVDKNDKIILVSSACNDDDIHYNALPTFERVFCKRSSNMPIEPNSLDFYCDPHNNVRLLIYKDIHELLLYRTSSVESSKNLNLVFKKSDKELNFQVSFVDNLGITFMASIVLPKNQSLISVPLSEFKQNTTYFLANTYPVFSNSEIDFDEKFVFTLKNSAIFEISTEKKSEKIDFGFVGAWID